MCKKNICGLAILIDPYYGECNVRSDLEQMQEVSEAHSLDDDMVDGDLGDGMEVRAAPSSIRMKSQSFAGLTESLLSRSELLRSGSHAGEAAWIPGLKAAERQQRARWKLPRSSKNLCKLSLHCNTGAKQGSNGKIGEIPSDYLISPSIGIADFRDAQQYWHVIGIGRY